MVVITPEQEQNRIRRQREIETARQIKLLTVTPESAFLPAVSSVAPRDDMTLPVLIAAGAFVVWMIFRK